jgi:hypothetical protein
MPSKEEKTMVPANCIGSRPDPARAGAIATALSALFWTLLVVLNLLV